MKTTTPIRHSKAGFTLVELLIYMALASVVVVIAGRVFVDAMGFRVRTVNKINAGMGANEVMQYLEEDLRRLGAKGWKTAPNSVTVKDSRVYIDTTLAPPDLSSFRFSNQGCNGEDSIHFKTGVYNDSGRVIDVATITWWVDANRNLMRRYIDSINGTQTMVMMSEVDTFQIEYGEYSNESKSPTTTGMLGFVIDSNSFGSANLNAENAETAVSDASGNARILIANSNVMGMVQLQEGGTDKAFTLKPGFTYGVEFLALSPTGSQWEPDSDYAALCIRTTAGAVIPGISDMQFYAIEDTTFSVRRFEFSSSASADVSAHFFLKSMTRYTGQEWLIKDFRLWAISRDDFVWATGFGSAYGKKRNVKALRLWLKVRGGTNPTNRQDVSITRIIPIPNNGV